MVPILIIGVLHCGHCGGGKGAGGKSAGAVQSRSAKMRWRRWLDTDGNAVVLVLRVLHLDEVEVGSFIGSIQSNGDVEGYRFHMFSCLVWLARSLDPATAI